MLNFISSMLGYDWNTNFPAESDLHWVAQVYEYLGPILYAIMAVVGAAGVIYSIVLGVNLAKAEDQSKRDEAKKRLITTIIAVAVTVVLIIFFNELFPMIIKAVGGNNSGNLPNHKNTGFIHM
ncbi:MAG TPA: hypothetical protein DEV78_04035 [Clostridiales bacterium]|nr:hypothetical protein [Clostridiales bacterium]